MKQISAVIIGAGGRGSGYANFATAHPERFKIVGVAEPRDYYRNRMVEKYSIPDENIFTDWKQLAARGKIADVAIITTLDKMHAAPAIAFAELKYNILLEKPMAPSENECRAIVEAVRKNKIFFAVCHVLRYTTYTNILKKIIDSGRIGSVVNIQHIEPVGYWHQAHSYIRGNCGNEEESSPMLLAKSCHDIDWISYIMGGKCEAVSSFGSLKHFRKEEKPDGAGNRCTECKIESTCPYSSIKIYIGRVKKGQIDWPVNVLTTDLTIKGIMKAIKEGPYGRCVYACDNDVVDNQVVNMLFDDNRTASFTMTAFCEKERRKTHIFGTRGEIYGDSTQIRVFDFLTDKSEIIDTSASAQGGHGGGDNGLIDSFLSAIEEGDLSKIKSGPDETLQSHLMVFAAERARKNNTVEFL